MQESITIDISEQEHDLALKLYSSERFGKPGVKVEILPPLYALIVKSLRKPENFKAVARALQKLGEVNGIL